MQGRLRLVVRVDEATVSVIDAAADAVVVSRTSVISLQARQPRHPSGTDSRTCTIIEEDSEDNNNVFLPDLGSAEPAPSQNIHCEPSRERCKSPLSPMSTPPCPAASPIGEEQYLAPYMVIDGKATTQLRRWLLIREAVIGHVASVASKGLGGWGDAGGLGGWGDAGGRSIGSEKRGEESFLHGAFTEE
jgi:hypothetical protein